MSKKQNRKTQLVRRMKKLIQAYYSITSEENIFIPGKTVIQYAGAIYSELELNAMIETLLAGWFGLGREGELLEKELSTFLGVKHTFLTNSGSSADLLAISSLMSHQFPQHLNPGDEVITPACTFPTVVASLIHCRLKPVFIDMDPGTLNPKPDEFEKALSKKTKLIFLVHTLGNPNDMNPIMKLANAHNLFVVEDNCDALGSTYDGRKTGTFGILSTESFYPAHHMTTAGEGGAVFLNDLRLLRILSSLREWGRACWCGASGGGVDGVCGVRFNYKIDTIPYDHKYIFSHIGYNLKPIEIQASMGRIQLKKLPKFIKARKKNFNIYKQFFKKYEEYFETAQPTKNSDPSWFAFPITIRGDAPFTRFELIRFLEERKIQTRPVFAGNILRQPGFRTIEHKTIGDLPNSNLTFTNTFFIGVYPGLTFKMIDYVKETFTDFLKRYNK